MKLFSRPVRPKYLHFEICYSALSGLVGFFLTYQGRRAPLRCALAPGFHISRLWRRTNFRASGAEIEF
jgi:hypothetical protein